MRRFLVKALQNAGFDVSSYDNGLSAYQRLREEPFELLLTDIVMPEMDGIELARRASELDPDIKIMFITGFAAVALNSESNAPQERQGAVEAGTSARTGQRSEQAADRGLIGRAACHSAPERASQPPCSVSVWKAGAVGPTRRQEARHGRDRSRHRNLAQSAAQQPGRRTIPSTRRSMPAGAGCSTTTAILAPMANCWKRPTRRSRSRSGRRCWPSAPGAAPPMSSGIAVTVADAGLDALIIVGDDQNEQFVDDNMPAVLVYAGESIVNNPLDMPEDAPEWWRRARSQYHVDGAARDYPVDAEARAAHHQCADGPRLRHQPRASGWPSRTARATPSASCTSG